MPREAFYVKMVLIAGITRLGAAVTLIEYLTQMIISQTSRILQASVQGNLISRICLNHPNSSLMGQDQGGLIQDLSEQREAGSLQDLHL